MPTVISSHSRTLASLSVDLAQSPRERHRALELHRDVYIRKGLLRDDTRQPQVLPQACAPGSAIFVATEHDAIVATIALETIICTSSDIIHPGADRHDSLEIRAFGALDAGRGARLRADRCHR